MKLTAAILTLFALTPVFSAESARFAAYTGAKEMAFAIDVIAPWPGGGRLTVNLPEHLQFETTGNSGIIREYNKELKGWQISEDGLKATLEADSPFQPNVHVKGEAKVVSERRIEFSIKVENKGKSTLAGINGLFCHHYRGLSGFPQNTENFKHTYVLLDGKVTPLADIATKEAGAAVKGANVAGCPQRPVDEKSFAAKFGGRIERDLDAALIAVTALDGKRKFLLAWTPGMCVLSNSAIPCVHGDPFFGSCDPGKTVDAKGVIVFSEEPIEDAIAALKKEGAGAPPKK